MLRSFLILFVLLFIAHGLLAQKKSKVFVEKTDVQRYTELIAKERLIGNVIIRQENTRFYCDSAYLNEKENSFEAFGNVHIDVNDSVDVFGDRMIYDGNTRIAEVFGNVKLVDKNTVLTTEHLVYNRNTKIAFYDVGGKIVNQDNTLVSERGYYNTETKILYFRKDVVLTNPESETYSDTLIYNTITETAFFKGPTIMRGTESTIYMEDGWYDTKSDYSKLTKRPVISSSDQTITADSIHYDNLKSYGKAFSNVEILDTTHQVLIKGGYAEMWDNEGKSFMTDRTLAITYDDRDSMYIHSDSMWMFFDKSRNAKRMLAYNNVRIFREDLQGKCDSLAYTMNDSTIRLYNEPILWSGVNQLSSDSISVVLTNNELDSLIMYNTAFMVSRDSTDSYNQIRGKDMVGYFRNNELSKIRVDGNAQTVYYIREDDGFLIGVNLAESSAMLIRLVDNDIKTINYMSKPKETMYPEADLPGEMKKLKGFIWKELLRPLSKEDIFITDPED